MRRAEGASLGVIKGALRALQVEMENVIERTAMSPFIHEKRDYFAGVSDLAGDVVVSDNYTSYGNVMDSVLAAYPAAEMKSGDIFCHNDCYGSDGAVSHSPDIVFVAPVFAGHQLVAFVHCAGHFQDIGGTRSGSLSPDATEIFQEGFILPVVRISTAGKRHDEFFRVVAANTRFPEITRNDMLSLVAATRIGVRRLVELAALYGAQTLREAFATLKQETARYVRASILDLIPEGRFSFAEAVDSDGVTGRPVWIRFELVRDNGRLVLDATASDDQSAGPVNFLMHPTVPQFTLALYVLAREPDFMHNGGSAVTLDDVVRRHGSVLHPRWPAALGSRGQTKMRVEQALLGLLARATAGASPAASCGYALYLLRGTDQRSGDMFLCTDGIAVGHGGRPDADGHDAIYGPGQHNYPVEYMEKRYPVRIERYGINVDSGGPGRFRGGCGVVRELTLLSGEAVLATKLDNVARPPFGVSGGLAGRGGGVVLNPGRADQRSLRPVSDGTVMKAGDTLQFATPGGGGWGHPFDRPPHLVESDVRDGFVSIESALEDYGVMIDRRTLRVDTAATVDRRGACRRPGGLFHRGDYFD
jgi:N-methylhydantoinase B